MGISSESESLLPCGGRGKGSTSETKVKEEVVGELFSLKESTAGVFAVTFRVLNRKKI